MKKLYPLIGLFALALLLIAGQSWARITNPSSSSGLTAANNLSDLASSSTARTNLGLTDTATLASSTWLKAANNLSDVASTTARTNLGLTDTATLASSTWVTPANNYKSAYFLIENPTATEDDAFYVFNATSTIQKVYAVNKTDSDTVTFNLLHATSRSQATSTSNHVFATDQAITATTTPSTLTSFASSTVGAGSVLRFYTSAASSTQFLVHVYYTEN